MRLKITKLASVAYSTIVTGNDIPAIIAKIKKNPKKYKWTQEEITYESWSGEKLPNKIDPKWSCEFEDEDKLEVLYGKRFPKRIQIKKEN